MNAVNNIDRRRFPRRDTQAQIDVLGRAATFGEVLDVGAGGLRTQLRSAPPRGELRLLRVFDVQDGEYHRWAQVMWVNPRDGGFEVGWCFRQPLRMRGVRMWGTR
jgi:hypothetical protein